MTSSIHPDPASRPVPPPTVAPDRVDRVDLETAPCNLGDNGHSVAAGQVDHDGECVDVYETPTLSSRQRPPSAAAQTVQALTPKLDSDAEFFELRYLQTLRTTFSGAGSEGARRVMGEELSAYREALRQAGEPVSRLVTDDQKDVAAHRAYQRLVEDLDDRVQALQSSWEEEDPNFAVTLRAADQRAVDGRILRQASGRVVVAETGAVGPAEGVSEFSAEILRAYQSLPTRAGEQPEPGAALSTAKITSEAEFIRQGQAVFGQRPADGGPATLIVEGHASTSTNREENFRGIRLSETPSRQSAHILSAGAEDHDIFRRALQGAQPGDTLMIVSCDGGSSDRQLQAYAQLVQETFPEGVHLVVARGKAHPDLTADEGFVVFTKR